VGGVGTAGPTGSGNNLALLDGLDTDFGNHKLQLEIIPTGTAGSVNILMYVDGNLVGGQGFSAFPETFQVVLTGQARAIGDTVNAVFDNLVVQQVPEPGSAALLIGGILVAFGGRRRRP
jgi:murein endopeptidase